MKTYFKKLPYKHCLTIFSCRSGCSSSSSAVHLACQSLRAGETKLCVAGGVNVILHFENPFGGGTQDTLVLANDFRCKTFDERANGFVRAEGCGAVVLKPYSDAIRDGDNIIGVIRGTALNNDGRGTSFGTPNAVAQERVIREALWDAGVEPRDVSVVEAHGTGTFAGDPTEMYAIGQVYSAGRTDPLFVSSVKTNIGHTESSAGIAGLIKILLCLKHKKIPPHLHLQKLNPKINIESIPAIIPQQVTEWKTENRIAAVSSFSMSGTNVHLIVQETPIFPNFRNFTPKHETTQLFMIGISAKTEEALEALITKHVSYLQRNNHLDISDIALSLNTGRASFPHRVAVLAKDTEQLTAKLQSRTYSIGRASTQKPEIIFLFTGQGSQYTGMCKNIYQQSSVFRAALNKCESLFKTHLQCSLKNVLWEDGTLLDKTEYCQPAIFCVQYALVEMWHSFGIYPNLVMGHSVGEFCAAVCSGVLSLEDAMKLVVERSVLVATLEQGKMLVVKTSPIETRRLIKEFIQALPNEWLDVAAENSLEEVVISGNQKTVLAFANFCLAQGCQTQSIVASHAFHSRQMDPILRQFGHIASEISVGKPTCRFLSSTLARELTQNDFEPSYWIRHLRDTVRFSDAVKHNFEGNSENKIFVEIGSQPILLSLTMANLSNSSSNTYCPSSRKNVDDVTSILTSISKMYIAGLEINWKVWLGESKNVILPTYPFQRQMFWLQNEEFPTSPIVHPLLGRLIPSPLSSQLFTQLISTKRFPYLADHRVADRVIFPAAGYLETIMAAGCQVLQRGKVNVPITIENFYAEAALELTNPCQVQTIVRSLCNEDGVKFEIELHKQISGNQMDKWRRHAVALFSPSLPVTAFQTQNCVKRLQERLTLTGSMDKFYTALAKCGLHFGPNFQSILRGWKGDTELLTEIAVLNSSESYICHPVVLDGMLQTLTLSTAIASNKGPQLKLPISIKKFTWFSKTVSEKVFAYCNLHPEAQQQTTVQLLSETGEMLAFMDGVEAIVTTVPNFLRVLDSQSNNLPNFLEEVWRPTSGVTRNRHNLENFTTVPSSFTESTLQSFSNVESYWKETNKRINKLFALFLVRAVVQCNWPWGKVGQMIKTTDWAAAMHSELFISKNPIILMKILQDYNYLNKVNEDEFQILTVLPSTEEIEAQVEDELKNNFMLLKDETIWYEFTKRCGTYLIPVLKGSMSPIEYMFPEDHHEPAAVRFYAEVSGVRDSNQLAASALLDSVSYARTFPGVLKILEVGGGSGAACSYVLKGLQELNMQCHYTFTDISPFFIFEAKKKFTKGVTFALFDIEEDPLFQGFTPEQFDIIIAHNVIHATTNIEKTLRNLNNVLRQNGLLIIGEPVEDMPYLTLSFGCLNGWWRYNDNRKLSPLLNLTDWKVALENTGFVTQKTFSIYDGSCGIILAQKTVETQQILLKPIMHIKSWLLISDGSKLEQLLENKLELTGRKCIKYTGDIPDDLEAIIFFWTSPVVYAESQEKCKQLLSFCQKFVLKYQEFKLKPHFAVVTRGVNYVENAGPGNPNAATSLSFVKSLATEHPDFPVMSVDLDQDEINYEREVTELIARIFSKDKEMFTAVRGDKIFVQRLVSVGSKIDTMPMPKSNRFKIGVSQTRSLNDLHICVATKVEPIDDQVEVTVYATGLNFRDIFIILQPEGFEVAGDVIREPGMDVAGVVSAVGPGCTKFKVGDNVFGCVLGGGLASHVIAYSQLLIKKPDEMTFTSAATIAVPFLTVFYSFFECTKLSSRDRILIHAATGGVGLAAIQVAKHLGSEIFATAGSRRKRAYLRSIGILNVYHSRDTAFRDNILKDTNGAGVDVVLNSLTGPGFKEATLDACAKNARFIEIGKINIWTQEEVKALRPDVNYFVVDFTNNIETALEMFKHVTEMIATEFDAGIYKGLPHKTFPLNMAKEAFYHFQEAKHIGKLVINIPETTVSSTGSICIRSHLFYPQSTYVITGGLGGIGMEVAKWMAKMGARNLVLVGRNHPSVKCQPIIVEMNQNGCRTVVQEIDVGVYQQCETLFKNIVEMNLPPVRGIMHAAGVLSEGIITNQAWEKFESVFQSKVRGTWNLHNLTKNYDLEFFTMFSSANAILGSHGQCNYIAANRFLDSFAHYRNSLGLVANSINFGPWSEVGLAADLKRVQDGSLGVCSFTPTQGILSLEQIMWTHRRQVAVVDVIDWKFITQAGRFGCYFDEIKTLNTHHKQLKEANNAATKKQLRLTPPEFRQSKIEDFLEKSIKETLRIPENEDLDRDQNFSEIGVDSLMAMELRNRLHGILDQQITVGDLQTNRTIRSLSAHIAKLMNSNCASTVSVQKLVEEDSLLAPEIVPLETKFLKPSQFREVLLTGSTGHLGVNLISALQAENPNLILHCILRGKDSEEATNRLKETITRYSLTTKVNFQKIDVLTGDLALENFGLRLEKYEALAGKIDAILHCAVKSNHLEEYNSFHEGSLRSINVQGTVNVLRFATAVRTKTVLYASSLLAATQVTEDECLAEEFPLATDTGPSIKNGYVLSKFVCEKLMSQAVGRGIPVTVIRYANIFGNSQTGFLPTQKSHAWKILTTCIRVLKFPSLGQNGIPIMAVDAAAEVTAQIFLRDCMERGVYNLTSSSSIFEEDILTVFAEFGVEGEFVSYLDWLDMVFQQKEKNEVAPFLSLYQEAGEAKQKTGSVLGFHALSVKFPTLKINSVSDKVRRNCPNFEGSIVPIQVLLERHLEFYYRQRR